MTLRKATTSQKKQAYRNAVEQALIEFYGKSAAVAERLVTGWWNRISSTSAFKTGLFMHPEAINTAADLAEEEVIRISPENEDAYHRLLADARDRALGSTEPAKSPLHHGAVRIWTPTGRASTPKALETKEKKREVKQKNLTASA